MTKTLHRDATRWEPYSDGPWFFAYDPAHREALKELKAYEALLGFASGADADRRAKGVAEAGLAIACELGHDMVIVDVLVGKKLSLAQKKKAEWVDPQPGYLRISSGRFRIDSLNSVAFGPDEPDSEGCELDVPAGEYDVVVHRVAWELMEDGEREDRPELPAAVLELLPVGRKGPKTKAACLTLAEARGEVGTWLIGGRVEYGVFHGTTRAHEHKPSIVYLNLRGAHAEDMRLRFGETLELTAGDIRVSAPFTGHLTRKGMEVYLGPEWYEAHMRGVEIISSFSPFQASTPWLVEVEGSGLSAGAPISATLGEPWCEAPPAYRDEVEIEEGKVTGRIVWSSPATLILNFGGAELRQAGLDRTAALELVVGDQSRSVHRYSDPGALAELRRSVLQGGTPRSEYVEAGALLANSMTYWDDPEVNLLWLMPLVGEPYWEEPKPGLLMSFAPQPGERHHLQVSPGSEIVLRRADA